MSLQNLPLVIQTSYAELDAPTATKRQITGFSPSSSKSQT